MRSVISRIVVMTFEVPHGGSSISTTDQLLTADALELVCSVCLTIVG